MDAKIIILLVIAINCYSSCGAALRRTPKVYNALITTDENLSTSRAFPVIQPTIHETGIANYPFRGYNPYGLYGPPLVRFGQPIAPGLAPREQLPYPLPQAQFPPRYLHRPPNAPPQYFPGYPTPQIPPTAPAAEQMPMPPPDQQQPAPSDAQQPVKPPPFNPPPQGPAYMPVDEKQPQPMPKEKLPIPLNEYGLPSSLIPLQQYPNHYGNPAQLPPYGYNQYPLVYDPITGIPEQYLPPYGYYPSHAFGSAPSAPTGPGPFGPQGLPQRPHLPPPPAPAPTPPAPTPEQYEATTTSDKAAEEADEATEPTSPPTETPEQPDFESIKNGSKSKNSAVPDVPPPPIPSGAKSRSSS